MNTRTLKWIVAAGLLLVCLGCAQPKYVHAVFFTCKDGTPDTEIDALIADGNDLSLVADGPAVAGQPLGQERLPARDLGVAHSDPQRLARPDQDDELPAELDRILERADLDYPTRVEAQRLRDELPDPDRI